MFELHTGRLEQRLKIYYDVKIGVIRIFFPGPLLENAPPTVNQSSIAYLPQTVGSVLKELQSSNTTLTDAGHFRQLGNRPVVVLTAMQKIKPEALKSMSMSEEQGQKLQATWKELQNDKVTC